MKMMNRLFCAFPLLIGLVGSMTAETSRQPGREIVAPAGDRPARVLGQARTEAEYEAFVALKSALEPLGKAESAQDFLERFPLSGLSPLAHQADRAIRSYARAAALDSFTSSLARQHLEKIYRHLHPPLPDEDQERYELRISHGLNGLVAQEREYYRLRQGLPRTARSGGSEK